MISCVHGLICRVLFKNLGGFLKDKFAEYTSGQSNQMLFNRLALAVRSGRVAGHCVIADFGGHDAFANRAQYKARAVNVVEQKVSRHGRHEIIDHLVLAYVLGVRKEAYLFQCMLCTPITLLQSLDKSLGGGVQEEIELLSLIEVHDCLPSLRGFHMLLAAGTVWLAEGCSFCS